MVDWQQIRATKISPGRPEEWPKELRAISRNGLTLFGIHDETGNLYWDGKALETKKRLKLTWYELLLAAMAAVGTFGVFVIDAGRSLKWWRCRAMPKRERAGLEPASSRLAGERSTP